MKKCDTLDTVACILLLIGGLNWGFIGFFGWDVVASVFGEMTTFTRVVYSAVGLSALWRIYCWMKCKSCR
jgi:uncharacterized membrane protein YuzA (DUF378 family)